jgi:hypothetical protein
MPELYCDRKTFNRKGKETIFICDCFGSIIINEYFNFRYRGKGYRINDVSPDANILRYGCKIDEAE